MEFEWDEAKNLSNLRKHGVAFEGASRALLDPDAIFALDSHEGHEERWRVIVAVNGRTILLVVYTDRGGR